MRDASLQEKKRWFRYSVQLISSSIKLEGLRKREKWEEEMEIGGYISCDVHNPAILISQAEASVKLDESRA